MTSPDLTDQELSTALTVAELRQRGAELIKRLLQEFHDYKAQRNARFQAEIQPQLDALLAVMVPAQESAAADITTAFASYVQLRDAIREHVDEQCRIARIQAESERAARIAAMPHCGDCGSHRLTPGGCLDCLYPPGRASKASRPRVRVRA